MNIMELVEEHGGQRWIPSVPPLHMKVDNTFLDDNLIYVVQLSIILDILDM